MIDILMDHFHPRLSESNVLSISSQIEELFRSHSRAELSEILAEAINGACISVAPIPERLISEQMLLIATLHMNVGGEVGEHILDSFISYFDCLSRLVLKLLPKTNDGSQV